MSRIGPVYHVTIWQERQDREPGFEPAVHYRARVEADQAIGLQGENTFGKTAEGALQKMGELIDGYEGLRRVCECDICRKDLARWQ